jgi:hypothetical protein
VAAIDRLIEEINHLAREANSRGWPYFCLPIVYTARKIGVSKSRLCQLRQKLERTGALVMHQDFIATKRARRYVPKIAYLKVRKARKLRH